MFETAQPQAGEPANQPEEIAVAEESYGGNTPEPYKSEDLSGNGADGPFMTVRYNKEDKPLSYEEAIAYTQKGMNYDKLQGRLKEMAQKLSEYENSSRPAQGGDGEEAKQALIEGQLKCFMEGNPGVDPRKLPESVIDSWKKGVPLSEAYLMHQTEQLNTKVRDMEKAAAQQQANLANQSASMGSAVSNGPTRGRQLTEDAIRNMTADELDRNHERIWTYLTKKQ